MSTDRSDRCWCGGKVRFPTWLNGDTRPVCLESEFHHPHATGKPDRIERLYVAGPMTGYPDSNYPAFVEAAHRLEDAGYIVVNPATAVVGNEAHYVDFLREDLRMMLGCHGVAMLENWWESSGARNEVSVAGLLRMPCRTLPEWLERASLELGS